MLEFDQFYSKYNILPYFPAILYKNTPHSYQPFGLGLWLLFNNWQQQNAENSFLLRPASLSIPPVKPRAEKANSHSDYLKSMIT